MRNSLLRPFLVLEFLIAIDAVFTLWSEAGGQYDLDLMFWPWKIGLGLGASTLIVLITAQMARNGGAFTRRARVQASLLVVMVLLAGMVTYYYHINEPADPNDDSDDAPAQMTHIGWNGLNFAIVVPVEYRNNRSIRVRGH
jgi:hypothetical protein